MFPDDKGAIKPEKIDEYIRETSEKNSRSARTSNLSWELDKEKDMISYEKIKMYITKGVDLDHRNHKGYTFSERAGFKQRLDIVDLLYRVDYLTNWGQEDG